LGRGVLRVPYILVLDPSKIFLKGVGLHGPPPAGRPTLLKKVFFRVRVIERNNGKRIIVMVNFIAIV